MDDADSDADDRIRFHDDSLHLPGTSIKCRKRYTEIDYFLIKNKALLRPFRGQSCLFFSFLIAFEIFSRINCPTRVTPPRVTRQISQIRRSGGSGRDDKIREEQKCGGGNQRFLSAHAAPFGAALCKVLLLLFRKYRFVDISCIIKTELQFLMKNRKGADNPYG